MSVAWTSSLCRIGVLAAGIAWAAPAGAAEFPFGRELLLDAAPMRPSKRIPSITVASDGSAVLDLWCRSVPAKAEVGAGTIAIVPAVPPAELSQQELPAMQGPGQCDDQRQRADAELLAALAQAAGWTSDGEAVTLTGGPQPLRFHPATN